MLLDRYLPRYTATVTEHTVVDADVATTWRAQRELDLLTVHTPLLDAVFFVRGLPERWPLLSGVRRPWRFLRG
jgi:hypothetical protein